MPTARVYVDGFNFYHGAIKKYPGRRWLDFWGFAGRLIPKDAELDEVHYFTTRILQRPDDPTAPERQAIYLTALQACRACMCTRGSSKAR
jgi:hypothetical protein